MLDVNLPSLDGWELASSEEYVVRMARCGAHGYVMKSQPTSELLEGIRRVFRGERYFPAGMTDALPAPAAKKLPPKKKART